ARTERQEAALTRRSPSGMNRRSMRRFPASATAAPPSCGHADQHTQSAHGAVLQRDVAAMASCDVAGDGKAQPRAALVLVPRRVEPHERLEHFLALFLRNAGAVVVYGDGEH